MTGRIAAALLTTALVLTSAPAHAIQVVPAGRFARATAARGALPQPSRSAFVPGRVLAIVNDPAPVAFDGAGRIRTVDRRLSGALARLGIEHGREIARTRRRGALHVVALERPGLDPRQAAAELMASGAVRAACPDYRLQLHATTPNDPYYTEQWYLTAAPEAVRYPLAWDVTHGDSSVVIAILDTGVDRGHPDLAAKMWRNPGEIAGNGLDDDGNGYVDDVDGWDFGVGDNDPMPEYTPDESGIDVGFHGTFCAGIAAAAGNEGAGMAGAAWACKLMAVKLANPDSGITSSAFAAGVAYALDNGADILSVSLGTPFDFGVPEFFQALVDASLQAGVLMVASSGNSGNSSPSFPAACTGALAVGATDDTGARAYFSTWGTWVGISAPGYFMLSSICRNYTLSEIDQIIYEFYFLWDGINPYMYGDGTSFACPLVAGTCGLVLSRWPILTPLGLREHMIHTGDVVAFDHPSGVKLDAYDAVNLSPLGVPPSTQAAVLRLAIAPNPMVDFARVRYALPRGGQVTLRVVDAAGRDVRMLSRGAQDAGDHELAWDGRDAQGRPAPLGLYFVTLETASGRMSARLVRLSR
jgi:subtilisin family serine protease